MDRSFSFTTPLTLFSVVLFVLTLPSRVHEIKAESRPDDTIAKPQVEEVKPLRFEAFPVQGTKSIQELKARLGENGWTLILKLNRTDPKNVRRVMVLAVPETTADYLSVAPLPRELKQAASIDKLILVSRRVQAFGAYESGKLVYWGPTSTGKRATPTPAGLYHTNWKAKVTRSTVDSSWVLPWCFNLDNFQGIAFHQYALPGYPASHGCVRLLEEDAKWIYHWADQWLLSDSRASLLAHGTPVIIFGDYKYGQEPPWKRLVADPDAASVSESEAGEALAKHLEVIVARAQARQTVIASIGQD